MFIIINQNIARFLVDIFMKEVVKYSSFVTPITVQLQEVIRIENYRLKESNYKIIGWYKSF
jgi:hypothetical protein